MGPQYQKPGPDDMHNVVVDALTALGATKAPLSTTALRKLTEKRLGKPIIQSTFNAYMNGWAALPQSPIVDLGWERIPMLPGGGGIAWNRVWGLASWGQERRHPEVDELIADRVKKRSETHKRNRRRMARAVAQRELDKAFPAKETKVTTNQEPTKRQGRPPKQQELRFQLGDHVQVVGVELNGTGFLLKLQKPNGETIVVKSD